MKNNMAGGEKKKKQEKSARNEKNNSFKWRLVFMFIWIVVYGKMWKKFFWMGIYWGYNTYFFPSVCLIYIKKRVQCHGFFSPLWTYGPRLILKMDWWSKGLNIGWKLLLIMILLSEGPFFLLNNFFITFFRDLCFTSFIYFSVDLAKKNKK